MIPAVYRQRMLTIALQYNDEYNTVFTGRATAKAIGFNIDDFTQNESFFKKHAEANYEEFLSRCCQIGAEVEKE